MLSDFYVLFVINPLIYHIMKKWFSVFGVLMFITAEEANALISER